MLKTPKAVFYKYVNYVKKKKKTSSLSLYADLLFASIKYNVSILDYFEYSFYEKNKEERSQYAGHGFMYEYQLKMNPKKYRDVLSNKIAFLKYFDAFAGRQWASLEMLEKNPELVENFLNNKEGKVVLKYSKGQCGKQVSVVETKNITAQDLLNMMKKNNFDLLEAFVVQHDEMMKMAPNGLNTVRIVTQYISNTEVQIIGTSLRLSIYSNIDNLNAGNIALSLDMETGRTINSGLYIDHTKENVTTHPLTGLELTGFKVPFWEECKALAKKAAALTPENKSIGWDIGITNDGPLLIEGNHDWGHGLIQVPLKKGIKKILSQFIRQQEDNLKNIREAQRYLLYAFYSLAEYV
jgi:hypothetical protein